jgi:hypothetical protein
MPQSMPPLAPSSALVAATTVINAAHNYRYNEGSTYVGGAGGSSGGSGDGSVNRASRRPRSPETPLLHQQSQDTSAAASVARGDNSDGCGGGSSNPASTGETQQQQQQESYYGSVQQRLLLVPAAAADAAPPPSSQPLSNAAGLPPLGPGGCSPFIPRASKKSDRLGNYGAVSGDVGAHRVTSTHASSSSSATSHHLFGLAPVNVNESQREQRVVWSHGWLARAARRRKSARMCAGGVTPRPCLRRVAPRRLRPPSKNAVAVLSSRRSHATT